jgi:hypothetical protein
MEGWEMHVADLLIHVDETLDTRECALIEEELRRAEGVIAPRFNTEKPHLLLVSYDPDKIDSRNLLSRVTDTGYSAQLIGM